MDQRIKVGKSLQQTKNVLTTKPLETTTVNRIAAGEIIVAPANALKELLENSFDAGASRVEVVVKDGGLKLLQITDDGHGIHKDDLPLLCQRFATSKIDRYEDLETIATYGFRGEALASISHVSRLSVITKRADSPCAWLATYSDGELKDVKPTAGRTGTQIIVEDLFYNVPSRLRAIKGGSEELTKIVDVAGRYAIHTNVGIGVKKFGESHFALSTRPGLNVKERIRSVFGNAIATELLPIDIQLNDYGVLNVTGQLTNPNFNNKKSIQPVFFINNRLVANDVLKRALNSTMSQFLPKGHKPFIYLSLSITPSNLDVNVHPTKRQVRFLHEDEIIDNICIKITEELSKVDSSRTFNTQTLLPHKRSTDEDTPKPAQKKRLDYKLVRTDASQAKITTFIKPVENDTTSDTQDDLTTQKSTYTQIDKDYTQVNLQSILDLRQEVQLQTNNSLTEMFANMSFIGIVDSQRRLFALQHDVKLMLVDYASLLNQFFYQVGLQEFSNFGIINLNDGIPLKQLLSHVYDSGIKTDVSMDHILQHLIDMKEMLHEYFSIIIEIEMGIPKLKALPLLIKDYIPPLSKLPFFLYRLGAKIDWEDEKNCLEGILHQISLLYIPETIEESDDQTFAQKKLELNDTLENVLIPAIKRKFLAPNAIKKDVVEIANLPGLYKVFERC